MSTLENPATLIVDTSGVQQGTSGAPLRVDPTGTTTQPVSGPLTDAQLRATAVPISGALTDAQLRATAVPVSGTVTATGPLTDAQLRATAVPVSGTVTATGPLTDAQLRATAVPVSVAPADFDDDVQAGFNGLWAINSNVLNTTQNLATATDMLGYRGISLTCAVGASVTAASILFEGSNDNTNWVAIPLLDRNTTTGAPVTTFTLASATNRWFEGPVNTRYFRARNSGAIVAGTLGVTVRLLREPPQNITNGVVITSGTVTTVTTVTTCSTVTTVAAVTACSLAGSVVTHVASAALTTTTTTTGVATTNVMSAQLAINVTVVSGTSPTLDVVFQESSDGGVTYYDSYAFERITAVGSYRSPLMQLSGSHYRFVQTVAGTTPSFTRSVTLNIKAIPADVTRKTIDRTIAVNTLNSTTPSMFAAGTNNSTMIVNMGAITTTAPAFQLEGSDDNSNWFSIGSPLTGVASSTVFVTSTTGGAAKFLRARISTAGVGATLGYVTLKNF